MNKCIVADSQKCIGCHACEIACVVAHNDHHWPHDSRDYAPRIRVMFKENDSLAVTCRQCEDSPCAAACPVDALYVADNIVKLDQEKCIGCKSCVLVCPFGAMEMVMTFDHSLELAQKCDLCDTTGGSPACVANCPTSALSILDEHKLVILRNDRLMRAATGAYNRARQSEIRFEILKRPPREGTQKQSAALRKNHFGEIYIGLNEQCAGYESERCLYCSQKAMCNLSCPLHNSIPDFVRLVREGKIIEAAELSNATSSLPEICGRVCPQDRLCESRCTLRNHGGAVTVGNIERYITDTAFEMGWRPSVAEDVVPRPERVAIIGAGPAGLGCADVLTRAGVKAEVFERHPEIGGLLTFGIPPFKLDKQLMAQRRQIFTDMGITFHLNCEVGKDIPFSRLMSEYDAVLLGVGTYGMMKAGLEHEDSPGVVQALPFLIASTREVMGLPVADEYPWIDVAGKKVVVLGGGDTAMDCVRTAVRRSAESVICAYRRDEASMPGSKKEVVNAREEGVEFLYNVQPQFIDRNAQGAVSGIGLIRTQLGDPGPDGRRRPKPVDGSEFILDADVLIMAFGFQSHPMPWLSGYNVQLDKWGQIKTGGNGRMSNQTTNPKIFASGDAVHGADLVVTAMAAGRQAAREMLNMFDEQAQAPQAMVSNA